MKRFLILLAAIPIIAALSSFCGMYVSKADGTLKNKTSQVILVRDGQKNVVTMYNDFRGDDRDFAMVVPVPVVLKKEDIKVVPAEIFQKLNDYSAPRLVEYYDENPCEPRVAYDMAVSAPAGSMRQRFAKPLMESEAKEKRVTIEAQYVVGEYDILILSAQESTGLRDWLTENGYKIPANADEVLEPYIRSNLKFFVAKVNPQAKAQLQTGFLRPIQIRYSSPKYMLPIRLGMANAAGGDQDLVVYAFTKAGRVECTNYRNKELPTGQNIPLFVKNGFGTFYNNLFQHQWKKEGKAVSFLEYAWDVSPSNYVKCDPCASTPPDFGDLAQAGVWWMNGGSDGQQDWTDYSDVDEPSGAGAKVFFTRMHFRYNRKSFPQDLMFQTTPNRENFQCRYVLTHPATGSFACSEGQRYLTQLRARRKGELMQLQALTGTTRENWMQDMTGFVDEVERPEDSYAAVVAEMPNSGKSDGTGTAGALIFAGVALGSAVLLARRKG